MIIFRLEKTYFASSNFNGVFVSLANFFAFDANQRGGVRVTAKATDGGGRAKLLAGSGDQAPPGVQIYTTTALSASTPTPSQRLSPFTESTLANGVFVR